MTEQQTLFPVKELKQVKNVKIEQEQYSREYCIKQILNEEYLWDMRCWYKTKEQYSKDEVKRQILKWISDGENGKRYYNCGHCVYCITKLLKNNWSTIDEIADLVIKNDKIKYADEIGTWFK